jgi:hypothetical protein
MFYYEVILDESLLALWKIIIIIFHICTKK